MSSTTRRSRFACARVQPSSPLGNLTLFGVTLSAPILTSGSRSLNDFVRPLQDRLRDRQPKRLGGLEIDHQLELRGLLDGENARLGTFQVEAGATDHEQRARSMRVIR